MLSLRCRCDLLDDHAQTCTKIFTPSLIASSEMTQHCSKQPTHESLKLELDSMHVSSLSHDTRARCWRGLLHSAW